MKTLCHDGLWFTDQMMGSLWFGQELSQRLEKVYGLLDASLYSINGKEDDFAQLKEKSDDLWGISGFLPYLPEDWNWSTLVDEGIVTKLKNQQDVNHWLKLPQHPWTIREISELGTFMPAIYCDIAQKHSFNGVQIMDIHQVWIDPDVIIGSGSRIYPGTFLLGSTNIGQDCIIEGHCWIQDSQIDDEAHVRSHCRVEKAHLHKNSGIGPFARIRPQSEIGQDVHIGNFVEVKKSTLGKGTKAGHLAYIGDTITGENCNIGAGVITCNYDGENKHQTTLGDNVFVGSDAQLVAPVELQDGSYIGAGATITKDVPKESLAISRVPQRIIKDWAKKKKG